MRKQGLIILFFSAIFFSCSEGFDSNNILIENQSNNSIYSILSLNDEMFDYNKFLIKERIERGEELSVIDITGLFISDEILPKSKNQNSGRPREWKPYINSSSDKKMRLFIIEKDSVDKYGWKLIHQNKIYNKKYLLTLDSLKKWNWKIIYKK